MIQVADNFNYRGKKPNFDRDSFDTLQDMKNYSENSLDDGHISYCKETDKHYKFNSNNQSDPTTGKWVEQYEAVPADEEDITEQNGTLQLANKTYDKQSFSGLGRVYLRKNIVGDKNVLTLPNTLIGTKTYDKFGNVLTWSKSDWLNPDGSLVTKVIFASKLNDFTKNNTIYNIVRYIDLKGETLTIPENSVLNFIGGAIGNGTIIGNKTKVINLNVDRIVLSGTWFDSGITSNRPTNVLVGFQYFDTTVNKPIFWDGSKWIDATGATV